jgi:translation initiation factor 3 subunit C
MAATKSRFFGGDSSDSESSSEEEDLYSDGEAEEGSEQDSDEEEEDDDEASSSDSDDGKRGVSKFLKDTAESDAESTDSDTPKIVKSAKNKRLEELEGVIKVIDNAVKISDWSSINTG